MSERKINKIPLRPVISRAFETSEEFVAMFGGSVSESGMFLPGPTRLRVGDALEIHFYLSASGRDILRGQARVEAVRSGSNGEQPGIHVRFVTLTERSRKNLGMLAAWRSGATS